MGAQATKSLGSDTPSGNDGTAQATKSLGSDTPSGNDESPACGCAATCCCLLIDNICGLLFCPCGGKAPCCQFNCCCNCCSCCGEEQSFDYFDFAINCAEFSLAKLAMINYADDDVIATI